MRWEYKTIKIPTKGILGGKIKETDLDQALNEQGNKGWELVSVFGTNLGQGQTRDVVAVFKKPS